jgi:hypothetical protein
MQQKIASRATTRRGKGKMAAHELTELFERHLLYEIWMLLETHKRLESPVSDVVIGNALIESFCIHARALIDFFNDRKGAKASSFALPTYVRFPAGSIPVDLVTKLNTQIAHLTHNRTSDPTQKIDHVARRDLLVKIVAELTNFLQHLKPEYRILWPSTLKVPSVPNAASLRTAGTVTTTSN